MKNLLDKRKLVNKVLDGLASSDDFIDELIKNKFSLIKKNLSEANFIKEILTIIQKINSDQAGVISLIGGEASGKTFLAKKMAKACNKLITKDKRYSVGAELVSTDVCLIEDRKWRRKYIVAEGRSIVEKYDPVALKQWVNEIKCLEDKEFVLLPDLDYKTGKALSREVYDHKVQKTKYLVIEGVFHFIEDSDLTLYLHVPDEVRNWNRYVREMKVIDEGGEKGLFKNLKHRHTHQQLKFTLPVAEKADCLITVDPIWNGGKYIYQYSLYKKS